MTAWLVALIQQYKVELFCLGMGIPFSWFVSVTFDALVPDTMPADRQRRLIRAICILGSFVTSAALWAKLDPADDRLVRLIVAAVAAMGSAACAPYVHKVALYFIAKKFPGVESAFQAPKP